LLVARSLLLEASSQLPAARSQQPAFYFSDKNHSNRTT